MKMSKQIFRYMMIFCKLFYIYKEAEAYFLIDLPSGG